MRMTEFLNNVFSYLSDIEFDKLVWIIWGAFGVIFVLTLILVMLKPKVRAASKRPFLCLGNAFTAITLAAFISACDLPQAIIAAAMFWVISYLLYGMLCILTKPTLDVAPLSQVAITSLPVTTPKTIRSDVPAAKSSVRLEHAISVTDKLLQKNLGKGDRQELEKLKNTLAVLQLKGTLSPTESDILNDNFNALLKLMAKYNI